MQPYVEPVESPKKRLSPILLIVGAILGVSAIFLLLPSNRSARMKKAQESLEMSFPHPAKSTMTPLFENELALKDSMGKLSPSDRVTIYVFAPTPKAPSPTQVINAIANPPSYFQNDQNQKVAVLLAPDPASTGWSLLAKVWIARCLQHASTTEVKRIGAELAMVGSTNSIKQLQDIWLKVPAALQKQSEDILEKNRVIAKTFGSTRCFFHDEKGVDYEIRMNTSSGADLYQFMYEYSEANPNPPPGAGGPSHRAVR